jgi:hypothetical protein
VDRVRPYIVVTDRRYRFCAVNAVRRHVLALATAVSVAAVVAAASAGAATTLSLQGVEFAASSTKGRFVGEAAGDAGVKAVWQAVVEHVPLGRGPSAITGGSFRLAKTRSGRNVGVVTGAFTAGTVALVSQTRGCGRQVFAVDARLGTSGGPGALTVRLTHLRRRIFGRCVAYAAYVTGTLSLP